MIEDSTNTKKVLIGEQEYTYKKDENGEAILTRNEIINNRNVEIVLRSGGDADAKDVENFVISVLSDLYIKRNLKKLN